MNEKKRKREDQPRSPMKDWRTLNQTELLAALPDMFAAYPAAVGPENIEPLLVIVKERSLSGRALSTTTRETIHNDLGGSSVINFGTALEFFNLLQAAKPQTDEEGSTKRPRFTTDQYTGEGLRLNDPVISFREPTCRQLVEASRGRIVLVKAPPYTGKTSLATLVDHHLRSKTEDHVLFLSFLSYREGDLGEIWTRKTGKPWNEWLDPSKPTTLILDEVQILYRLGAEHPFWRRMKELLQQQHLTHLSIILFAAYGERPVSSDADHSSAATPIAFDKALDLSLLRLRGEEFQELITNYNRTETGLCVPISQVISTTIYCATKGHAGLVRRSMLAISEQFIESSKMGESVDDADVMAFLLSSTFASIIQSTRAVPYTAQRLSDMERRILDGVLFSSEDSLSWPLGDPDEEAAAKCLIMAGILTIDARRLTFAAPLIRSVFLQRLHTMPLQRDSIAGDFDNFIQECIVRMNPTTLRDSLSKGVDERLLERQWQMEFYRAATSILPRTTIISPDVGHVFASDGYIDFYVDGDLQWAIELLREGKDMRDHEKRFEPGGLYHTMHSKIRRHAILDFRMEDKQVRELRENFWYILYAPDYARVMIRRPDKEDLTVPLLGGD